MAGPRQGGLSEVTIRTQRVQTELDSCLALILHREIMSVVVQTLAGRTGDTKAVGDLDRVVMNEGKIDEKKQFGQQHRRL